MRFSISDYKISDFRLGYIAPGPVKDAARAMHPNRKSEIM